jgi:hypothetical protein
MKENTLGNLTNVQVVILALLALGGDQQDVDTEDVAVTADAISPGRFSWRKHKQHISLEDVRISLKDAKRLGSVQGGTRRGWHLTGEGVRWATENQWIIESGLPATERTHPETQRRHALERGRLADLSAWKKYKSGELITRRDAYSVFRVTEYADEHRRSLLVERLRSLMAGDSEFGTFIEEMAGLVTTPTGVGEGHDE